MVSVEVEWLVVLSATKGAVTECGRDVEICVYGCCFEQCML